ERLAVRDSHGGRRVRLLKLHSGADARRLVDLLVGRVDGLLLVLGELFPRFGSPRGGGGALVNQQHVLHRVLLCGMVAHQTNGRSRNRQERQNLPRLRMRKLIYSMGVSLDGYIADPHGEIDWSVPDEELHRFHNQQARETGVFLFGRRMYETMTFWETAEEQPSLPEVERDFARIYKETPKVVFSKTLDEVAGKARL